MTPIPITYRMAYLLYRNHFAGILPAGFEWWYLAALDDLPTGWDITLTWTNIRGLAGIAGRKLKAMEAEIA